MKEIIKILSDDHEIIAEKIKLLNAMLNVEPAESFPQIHETLSFFEDFLFQTHHKKEEQVLYAWMVQQNERADNELIKKIIDDHNSFHKKSNEIKAGIELFLKNRPGPTALTILYDLSEFISSYIEHIEREENFIYEIANGLSISEEETAKLLKKLSS